MSHYEKFAVFLLIKRFSSLWWFGSIVSILIVAEATALGFVSYRVEIMFTFVNLVKFWFIFGVSFCEASYQPSIHWDPRNPLWVPLLWSRFFFSSRTLTTTNQNLMACDMKTATALRCNALLKNGNVFMYMHNFCIPFELPEILSRLCTYCGLSSSKPGLMYI